jgi:hypothetical protein
MLSSRVRWNNQSVAARIEENESFDSAADVARKALAI